MTTDVLVQKQGGQELAGASFADAANGLIVVAALVFLLPLIAFLAARFLLGFDIPNATGGAALYGSVSSVTFVVSRSPSRRVRARRCRVM